MPTTMKLIAKNVLSSSASSVTFSDIPGTYTDLVLLSSARTNRNDGTLTDGIKIRFNGDTATGNYSERRLYSTGSTVVSNTEVAFGGYTTVTGTTADTFGNSAAYIPNYAGSTKKSLSVESVTENNATAAFILIDAVLWQGTDAITSIALTPDVGTNFVSGSSFYLYGITKA